MPWFKNQYGEYLVNKRPETGLLANFYEFLSFEYVGEKEPKELLIEKLSPICEEVKNIELVGTFTHVFSHRIWEMESYSIDVKLNIRMRLQRTRRCGLTTSN